MVFNLNYIPVLCSSPVQTLREHQTDSIYIFISPQSSVIQHFPFIPRIQSFKPVTLFVTSKIILSSFHRMTKIYVLHCFCYKISLKKNNFDLILSYALSVTGALKTSTKEYLQVEYEIWGGHCLFFCFRDLFSFFETLIYKFRISSIKAIEKIQA